MDDTMGQGDIGPFPPHEVAPDVTGGRGTTWRASQRERAERSAAGIDTVEVSVTQERVRRQGATADVDRTQQLVRALVAGREDLYLGSASFHHEINVLARMMGTYVDLCAANAIESDAEQARVLASMRELPTVDVQDLMDSLRPRPTADRPD